MNEAERNKLIRELEWRGTEAAYADSTVDTYPWCGAVKPSESALWNLIGDFPASKLEPIEEPDGPAHEPDCKLAALIAELPDV